MNSSQQAVLIVNLGSPDSPEPQDVKRYLKEFLMDPLVIDIPFPLRWFLVHVLIAPRRCHESSEAYKKIWTKQGSPLIETTRVVAEMLSQQMGENFVVDYSMRYGSPKTIEVLDDLAKKTQGPILVAPLYPHYALSSSKSVEDQVVRSAQILGLDREIRFLKPFYDRDEFIEPMVQIIKDYQSQHQLDHLLFSYHGLPERHVRKTDPSGSYCLAKKDCCEHSVDQNRLCYRHHCFETTKAVTQKMGLQPRDYSQSFQSRLGRDPWIKPYTDHLLDELPKKGIKRLGVVCPAFVADCLETLEEIQIRGREQWLEAGGEELVLIPCVNTSEQWVAGLKRLIQELTPGVTG